MVSPLQGSQAAPRLPWSLESSPKPSEAWSQGWIGELCRSKNGAFNTLRHREHGHRVPHLQKKDKDTLTLKRDTVGALEAGRTASGASLKKGAEWLGRRPLLWSVESRQQP